MLENISFVMGIISFIMGVFVLIRVRQLIDRDTVRLFKQVKSWWGTSQGQRSGVSRANSVDYAKGSQKVGSKIKGLVPFGLLDDLTDAEVHAYIMNEDTVKFFIKIRQLVGGEWKLPGMPELKLPNLEREPRTRDRDDVPVMK